MKSNQSTFLLDDILELNVKYPAVHPGEPSISVDRLFVKQGPACPGERRGDVSNIRKTAFGCDVKIGVHCFYVFEYIKVWTQK